MSLTLSEIIFMFFKIALGLSLSILILCLLFCFSMLVVLYWMGKSNYRRKQRLEGEKRDVEIRVVVRCSSDVCRNTGAYAPTEAQSLQNSVCPVCERGRLVKVCEVDVGRNY